jgi:ubiquinone/menaquinone biosynthesis C-methylase UbiE
MAESILGAWWERLTGRLRPRPCPYSLAGALEMPGRRLLAGPRRVLDAFGVGPGVTVLEIGPGTGFYSAEVARRVGPSGRLVCLDVQAEMLQHARRVVHASGVEAAFLRADARALPLRSGSVDHVLLVTVLGEIPDRALALAEIRRALRPGGRLSVSEQFPDPDFVTIRTLRRELAVAGFVERETRGWLLYASTWVKPGAPARAAAHGTPVPPR